MDSPIINRWPWMDKYELLNLETREPFFTSIEHLDVSMSYDRATTIGEFSANWGNAGGLSDFYTGDTDFDQQYPSDAEPPVETAEDDDTLGFVLLGGSDEGFLEYLTQEVIPPEDDYVENMPDVLPAAIIPAQITKTRGSGMSGSRGRVRASNVFLAGIEEGDFVRWVAPDSVTIVRVKSKNPNRAVFETMQGVELLSVTPESLRGQTSWHFEKTTQEDDPYLRGGDIAKKHGFATTLTERIEFLDMVIQTERPELRDWSVTTLGEASDYAQAQNVSVEDSYYYLSLEFHVMVYRLMDFAMRGSHPITPFADIFLEYETMLSRIIQDFRLFGYSNLSRVLLRIIADLGGVEVQGVLAPGNVESTMDTGLLDYDVGWNYYRPDMAISVPEIFHMLHYRWSSEDIYNPTPLYQIPDEPTQDVHVTTIESQEAGFGSSSQILLLDWWNVSSNPLAQIGSVLMPPENNESNVLALDLAEFTRRLKDQVFFLPLLPEKPTLLGPLAHTGEFQVGSDTYVLEDPSSFLENIQADRQSRLTRLDETGNEIGQEQLYPGEIAATLMYELVHTHHYPELFPNLPTDFEYYLSDS